MGERTTISISTELRDAVMALGKKDETWDDLLRRLLADKVPGLTTAKEPAQESANE